MKITMPQSMELSMPEIERRLLHSCRDNCINWRGAPLRSGDHVLLKRDGAVDPTVVQLIDLMVAGAIPVGEVPLTTKRGKNRLKRMALVRILPFADKNFPPLPRGGDLCHLPYSLKEVSLSTIVEWVPVEFVVNICFIFHVDAIQKGFVSCGGMERVYCVRFKNVSSKLLPLKESSFKPFYRDPKYPFQESVPESIWSTLSGLKLMVSKEMSCGGVWDGRTKLARMNGVPPSFFGYIKAELEDDQRTTVQYNKIRISRMKKHMFDNFAACNVRTNSVIHQIRVLEEDELDNVRKVCGNSFGVGITVPVPSLKEVKLRSLPFNGTVWMRQDHQVRIVTCHPYEQDLDTSKAKRACPVNNTLTIKERPWKLRCSYRGLDFRHMQSKNGTWDMSVQVRFCKVRGNSPAVLKAQGVVLSTEVVSDVESEDLEVTEGVLIRLGSPPHLSTYIVDSIDTAGNVFCKDPTDENEAPVILKLEEANRIYNKYIRY
jgi:hypothetical protein